MVLFSCPWPLTVFGDIQGFVWITSKHVCWIFSCHCQCFQHILHTKFGTGKTCTQNVYMRCCKRASAQKILVRYHPRMSASAREDLPAYQPACLHLQEKTSQPIIRACLHLQKKISQRIIRACMHLQENHVLTRTQSNTTLIHTHTHPTPPPNPLASTPTKHCGQWEKGQKRVIRWCFAP